MDTGRMMLLTTVPGAFHAQVLAARLGADGIVTQLRGAIGGPYPVLGEVDVLVPADAYEEARALLLADAVDGVMAADPSAAPAEPTRAAWVALVAVALLVVCSLLLVQALAGRGG